MNVALEWLRKYAGLLGRRTTYASDIDKVGRQHFGPHWGGVLARDNMTPPGHMRAFVVNTDESTGRGVHWLAALDVNEQRHFNDPLGGECAALTSCHFLSPWLVTCLHRRG
jgi:hypothetical protein